ncbi:TetR/AcrR family transcriptional regulator C-terminal domain-containing protein [Amycolatopsis rhabdoformis]|uniref:TetR/AcrR family transcriptional regulator C-terminal domain-containing protein n=1 Tax=Amycolatopsis rhabdoformis TaxID=1448059 RepID=A0ABZ1HU09_9PSEU|nr:TetR/AcrR family transcriptional regulator C-terminal domain-containing protein [Amycolatopsis rhabdoformis]WSE25934.1 TetR/AcrR family transcriptional regulator C-terminal domain-containing protein [Amycolatopsis rhabdoformis]
MSAQGTPTPPIWLLPEPPERRWGLGRAEIVKAAIAIADAGGAEALTMRAVAKELGSSTPMSLYRYVHNKDGLVDLMLDAANGEISTPEKPGGDWRAQLTSISRDSWEMMKRHRWFAELVHQRPPAGPQSSRRQEFVLATFVGLGQELSTAVGYHRLLDGYVVGQALQRAEEMKMWRHNRFGDLEDVQEIAGSWFVDVGDGLSTPYPLLEQVLKDFLAALPDPNATPAEDVQFTLGLECLLDGIAARL